MNGDLMKTYKLFNLPLDGHLPVEIKGDLDLYDDFALATALVDRLGSDAAEMVKEVHKVQMEVLMASDFDDELKRMEGLDDEAGQHGSQS